MSQVKDELNQPDNLSGPDRWQSIVTLEKIGKPAVDYLVMVLKDPDKWVRYAAADTLGEIGDFACVDPLIGLLGDHDQDVRLVIAKALGKIGGPGYSDPSEETCCTDKRSVIVAAEETASKSVR